jgi:hypothetical protein
MLVCLHCTNESVFVNLRHVTHVLPGPHSEDEYIARELKRAWIVFTNNQKFLISMPPQMVAHLLNESSKL